MPPNGSWGSGFPGRERSFSVGRSYGSSPSPARSTDRIAPDSAYSGRNANSHDGAPMFVFPPTATYIVPSSSTSPFGACTSSERGSPRTRIRCRQAVPFHRSREIVPEFVSRFVSPASSPPQRGSLDVA